MRSIIAIDVADEDANEPATVRVFAGSRTREYTLTPALTDEGVLVSVTVHDEAGVERGVYESDLAACVDVLEDDYDRCGACRGFGTVGADDDECDACGGGGAL